jgi:branched-chain amino acid transport system ATP-binding protein
LSLIIEHIAKSFEEKKILRDVSFSLSIGKISVLMGVNGSGKTTLFNVISGFCRPDHGHVIYNGIVINQLEPYKINRLGINRTFQDLRLIKDISVMDNVLLAFPNQKGENWWSILLPNSSVMDEQKQLKEKAQQILKECFLSDVIHLKAKELSFGQQKLLSLACSFANNANVLLLDEPVAGVNPLFRDYLVSVINNFRELKKIILIIEHNRDFIEAVADDLMFLNEGKVLSFETYSQLRNNDIVKEAYV